MLIFVI